MDANGFSDLMPDGLHGVQRGHRFLKHHADVIAADGAELGFRQGQQVLIPQHDMTARLRPLRQQLHRRQRGHGFARAAFAGHGHDLSGIDGQGDIMQDVEPVDRQRQVGDTQQGHLRVTRSRGSSASRSPSPIRFSPSTVRIIAKPGTSAICGAMLTMVCASASMRPQEGVGGCAPSPT